MTNSDISLPPIVLKNGSGSVQIFNLRCVDFDDDPKIHLAFDVSFQVENHHFCTTFCEVAYWQFDFKQKKTSIVDECNQQRQLVFDSNQVALQIVEQQQHLSNFYIDVALKAEPEKIEDFKIELKAYVEFLLENKNAKCNVLHKKNKLSVKTVLATMTELNTVTELLAELYKTDFEQLYSETKELMSDNRQAFFLSYEKDKAVGVAHVSLRSEYINGTEFGGTCGFLEGIFVRPEFRKNGIATQLLQSCQNWAKQQGCREFASDCLLENTDSYKFHLKMGFTQTERCIFFRKEI